MEEGGEGRTMTGCERSLSTAEGRLHRDSRPDPSPQAVLLVEGYCLRPAGLDGGWRCQVKREFTRVAHRERMTPPRLAGEHL